jgi:hypothetical protein
MMVHVSATDVGIGLAAVGALAAAFSAFSSARGIALSHRPYVYGERATASKGEQSANVRLHNDGPGMAAEARCRVGAQGVQPGEWTQPVRAMQPGEVQEQPQQLALPSRDGKPARDWYIETEFSDIRGARWRLRNDRATPDATARLQRVRAGKLDPRLWRASRED